MQAISGGKLSRRRVELQIEFTGFAVEFALADRFMYGGCVRETL